MPDVCGAAHVGQFSCEFHGQAKNPGWPALGGLLALVATSVFKWLELLAKAVP